MSPVPAGASPARSVPSANSAPGARSIAGARSTAVAQVKPQATLTLTQTTDPRGRIRLKALSNARNVTVVYRTASGHNRKVSARIRQGVARVKLPSGATGILAQTKATSRLARSPLVVATPPALPALTPRRRSPGPVSAAAVSTRSENSITLSWVNPPARDLLAILVYEAAVAPPPGQPWGNVTVLPRTATSFLDGSLEPNRPYTYTIITVDRDLNVGPPVTVTASTLPDATPPGPVGSVTVGRVTRRSIQLKWADPLPVNDLSRVQIRRSTGSVPPATLADGAALAEQPWPTSKTFTDAGLEPATQYSYSLFALDLTGNASSPVSLTTATSTWVTIIAGSLRTCILDNHGSPWCWGLGAPGAEPKTSISTRPVQSPGAQAFSHYSLGWTVSCGVETSGAASCWGGNNTAIFADPQVAGDQKFSKVSAGYYHGCALAASGAAWCVGSNEYGQLGNGVSGGRYWLPVRVLGGQTFTSLTNQGESTCGLDTAGKAWCWGRNDYGQLGDGTTTNRSTPVAVAGSQTFTTLTTGMFHTCGLDPTGSAWCWGTSLTGLADASTNITKATPTAAAVGQTFTSLTAGYYHTCGLTPTGAALCWPSGIASSASGTVTGGLWRATPNAVPGGHTFTSLSAAGHSTCGLDVARSAWCWGSNFDGQLGDGTTIDRPEPVAVLEPAG